ncbi:MAG: MFS transporter [Verrucomicrobiota bacterium]
MRYLKSKWLLLSVLYLAQTVPMSFFVFGFPAILRQHGMSLENIGLLRLVAVPWMLKFLWSPLVDRTALFKIGRRKSWIVISLFLAIGVVLTLSQLNLSEHFSWIIGGFILTSILCATNDIATDGFAVELLDRAQRPTGNAIQVASIYAARIIGAGILLVTYEHLGWRETMLFLALMLSLPLIPILFFPETPSEIPQRHSMWSFFRQPGIFSWLLLMIIMRAGVVCFGAMLRPYMIDLKFSVTQVGVLLGMVGFSAALAGSLLSGWSIARWGRKNFFLFSMLFNALAIGLLPWVSPAQHVFFFLLILLHFIGEAANATIVFTMIMDRCRRAWGGTDFSIQQSLFAFTLHIGALSGFLAQAWGYSVFFVLCTALTLLAVPLALKTIDWNYQA